MAVVRGLFVWTRRLTLWESVKKRFGRTRGYGPTADYWYMPTGGMTPSGVNVTIERAMQTTAVYGCVNLIARTISSLPLQLTRRSTRENLTDHPLYLLMRDAPNPEMDSFQWWELMITHLELRGNAYAEIQRAGNRIIALWPLHPDNMRVERVDGEIRYTYKVASGQYAPIRKQDMLHFRLYSEGGLKGISPIAQAANAIGLAIAAEDFSSRYFDGDAMPRVAAVYDSMVPPDAKEEIANAWRQSYGGVDRSYRLAILGNGARIEKIGIAPNDAQVLDQRKYQTVEICRIWNVPPHLIGELDRPTFNTVEQLDLDFGKHSIRPRLVRIERATNCALLSPANWGRLVPGMSGENDRPI